MFGCCCGGLCQVQSATNTLNALGFPAFNPPTLLEQRWDWGGSSYSEAVSAGSSFAAGDLVKSRVERQIVNANLVECYNTTVYQCTGATSDPPVASVTSGGVRIENANWTPYWFDYAGGLSTDPYWGPAPTRVRDYLKTWRPYVSWDGSAYSGVNGASVPGTMPVGAVYLHSGVWRIVLFAFPTSAAPPTSVTDSGNTYNGVTTAQPYDDDDFLPASYGGLGSGMGQTLHREAQEVRSWEVIYDNVDHSFYTSFPIASDHERIATLSMPALGSTAQSEVLRSHNGGTEHYRNGASTTQFYAFGWKLYDASWQGSLHDVELSATEWKLTYYWVYRNTASEGYQIKEVRSWKRAVPFTLTDLGASETANSWVVSIGAPSANGVCSVAPASMAMSMTGARARIKCPSGTELCLYTSDGSSYTPSGVTADGDWLYLPTTPSQPCPWSQYIVLGECPP